MAVSHSSHWLGLWMDYNYMNVWQYWIKIKKNLQNINCKYIFQQLCKLNIEEETWGIFGRNYNKILIYPFDCYWPQP